MGIMYTYMQYIHLPYAKSEMEKPWISALGYRVWFFHVEDGIHSDLWLIQQILRADPAQEQIQRMKRVGSKLSQQVGSGGSIAPIGGPLEKMKGSWNAAKFPKGLGTMDQT